MGFIRSVMASSFSRDGEGRFIFYPYGLLGKGRYLPNKQKKEKLEKILLIYIVASFLFVGGSWFAFGWLCCLIAATITFLAYNAVLYMHLKGLEKTIKRMTWKERGRNLTA